MAQFSGHRNVFRAFFKKPLALFQVFKIYSMNFQIFCNESNNSGRWKWGESQDNAVPRKIFESCDSLYWFPEYLDKVRPFKSQYNFEWKRYLLWKNSEGVRKSVHSRERFVFFTPKIVQSVFNVCKILGQPPEVRYLAIAVLDGFLSEHFFRVRQTFEEMEDKSLDTWQAIVERILKQAPLRILTSIQLAMKYSWSCNIITATDIQALLEYLGHKEHYPKKSILKSEARIFQHLNFNIPNKTPLTYLEMFFDDFQEWEFFNVGISLHDFFITCIYALDVAFVFHQEIYANLAGIMEHGYAVSMKERTALILEKNFTKFFLTYTITFTANYVVLAASVIFVSSVLRDSNTDTSKLLETLSSTGDCTTSDIQALGKELLHVILKG